MTRHARLAFASATALALSACNPAGQAPSSTTSSKAPTVDASAGTAQPSAAASTPASGTPAANASAAPTITPSAVVTAPPAQLAAGLAAWNGASPVLADEARLAAADLLGDVQAGSGVAARKLLQSEAELTEASAQVPLTAAGRTAARGRRAAVRAAAQAALDGQKELGAAIAAAYAKGATRVRAGGGTIRFAELTIPGRTGDWTARLIRAVDAEGDLVYTSQQAKSADGAISATRTRLLREDGGAVVKYVHTQKVAGGLTLNATWAGSSTVTGTLVASGILQFVPAAGVGTTTLQVSLRGTEAAPVLALKDPAAKVEVEVAHGLGVTGAGTLIRLDADNARVPLPQAPAK